MGIAAPAVPGIAEAVQQSGRADVKVTGLSLPEHVQAVRARGHHQQRRAVEHGRPRAT